MTQKFDGTQGSTKQKDFSDLSTGHDQLNTPAELENVKRPKPTISTHLPSSNVLRFRSDSLNLNQAIRDLCRKLGPTQEATPKQMIRLIAYALEAGHKNRNRKNRAVGMSVGGVSAIAAGSALLATGFLVPIGVFLLPSGLGVAVNGSIHYKRAVKNEKYGYDVCVQNV